MQVLTQLKIILSIFMNCSLRQKEKSIAQLKKEEKKKNILISQLHLFFFPAMDVKWYLGGNKPKKVEETTKLLTMSKKLITGRYSAHRLQQFCTYFKKYFSFKAGKSSTSCFLVVGQIFVPRKVFPAQGGVNALQCRRFAIV